MSMAEDGNRDRKTPKAAAPAGGEEGPVANKRGAARLAAVQALYQMDVAGTPLDQVLKEFELFRLGKEIDGEQYRLADADWFRRLVSGVVRNQRKLDPQIHAALAGNWPLKRIDTTLRAILRAGAYELVNRADVPAPVVINEYVDVANAFFENDEPGIVNGVLDRLAKSVRTSADGKGARSEGS